MQSLNTRTAVMIGCALSILAGCNSPWRASSFMADTNRRAAQAQAQMVDSYVRSVGRAPRSRVSFWPRDNPICIRVTGQPQEWADYIKALIRYDGLMADAPMDSLKCHDVTLQIVFTDKFDDFVQDLATHKPDAFGYRSPAAMWSDLATVKGPLHAWYKKFDDDDFLITSVLIIIDKSAIRDIKPAALADYLAFISLSEVNAGKYLPAAPTILNLISGRGVDGAPPTELSELDRLYVKSIYGVGVGPDELTTHGRVEQRIRNFLLQRPASPEMFASSRPSTGVARPPQQ